MVVRLDGVQETLEKVQGGLEEVQSGLEEVRGGLEDVRNEQEELRAMILRKYALTPLLERELNNMKRNSEHNNIARLANSMIKTSNGRLNRLLGTNGQIVRGVPQTAKQLRELHCNYPNPSTCMSLR